ncbi:MAG: hypothetical protein BAJALOKI3v1_430022 [Promethearchaeota archaeon]|jgi:hypothetical protein|nr:MAG: hypothetical protein BAJALOKI3v1_430022 [Candidatus Lokiarchaeota archaeon]
MSENHEKTVECPYCGVLLSKPYWAHVQEKHPEEYEKKQTWISLFKDYKGMGMDDAVSLQVIGELFNVDAEEVRFFLEQNNIL